MHIHPAEGGRVTNGEKDNISPETQEPSPSGTDSETTRKNYYQGDKCDLGFDSEKGLKCPKAKKHKLKSPIPQVNRILEMLENNTMVSKQGVEDPLEPSPLPKEKPKKHSSLCHKTCGGYQTYIEHINWYQKAKALGHLSNTGYTSSCTLAN